MKMTFVTELEHLEAEHGDNLLFGNETVLMQSPF